MSRLLLVHERSPGDVDVLLADSEAREHGVRVFRRGGRVVLRVADGDVLVVRDVRNPARDRAGSIRSAPQPVLFGQQRCVAAQ